MGIVRGRGRDVGRDAALDGIAAEPAAGAGREQRVLGCAAALGDPDGEDCFGFFGERDGAVLAAFAFDRTQPPVPSVMSAQLIATSSETRRPAWIVRVSIARSRRPSQRSCGGASISAWHSSAVRKVTARRWKRLGGMLSTRPITAACSGCRTAA